MATTFTIPAAQQPPYPNKYGEAPAASESVSKLVFNDNDTLVVTKGGSDINYAVWDNKLIKKVETAFNAGEKIGETIAIAVREGGLKAS
jgi:hypothetical protein